MMIPKVIQILALAFLFIINTTVEVETAQVLEIENGILKSIAQLTTYDKFLNLSNLELTSISPGVFDSLTHITSLDLSDNKINELPESIFSNLTNLEELSLARNNCSLDFITDQLSDLKKLKVLNLQATFVKQPLKNRMFFGLPDDTDIQVPNLFISVKPKMFDIDLSKQAVGETEETLEKTCPSEFLFALQMQGIMIADAIDTKDGNLDPKELMICMSDGIVESVEADSGNCTHLHKETRNVQMENRGIKGFKKNWYRLPNKHLKLWLENNEISIMNENVLNDLPESIKTVYLTKNNISTLRNGVMRNKNLVELTLVHNNIELIESNAFEGLSSLWYLALSRNKIKDLNFLNSVAKSIMFLELGHNDISYIPDDSFLHLTNLHSLNLTYNKISSIGDRAFVGLSRLNTLMLTGNEISKIKKGPWDNLNCIQVLELAKNNFEFIDKGFASNMNNLRLLLVDGRMKLTKFERGVFHGMPVDSAVQLPGNVEIVQPGLFKNYSQYD